MVSFATWIIFERERLPIMLETFAYRTMYSTHVTSVPPMLGQVQRQIRSPAFVQVEAITPFLVGTVEFSRENESMLGIGEPLYVQNNRLRIQFSIVVESATAPYPQVSISRI